jgi:hypothetical protein
MACRDMLPGTSNVVTGIIEKQISTKGFKKWAFVTATQKKRFIQTDPPLTQGQNDPFMSRCRARRHQGGSDRTGFYRETFLKVMQSRQESLEGPT